MKKNGSIETRLQTSQFTSISVASPKEIDAFKSVTVEDISVDGMLIGFSNISCYFSCARHWKKLDEDQMCPVCENQPQDTKFDFKAELLLEVEGESDNIKTYLIFKRAANMITVETTEEEIENKLAEYEGKKCKVEHDQQEDEDKSVIVKRLITYV